MVPKKKVYIHVHDNTNFEEQINIPGCKSYIELNFEFLQSINLNLKLL